MLEDNNRRDEEREFIKALRSKDAKAYSIFYNHYAAALNGIIAPMVNDEKVQKKVLTELICDIWQDIANYKSEKQRIFTWMVNKARSRARNAGVKYNLNLKDKSKLTHTHVSNIKSNTNEVNRLKIYEDVSEVEMNIFNLIYYKGVAVQKVAEDQKLKVEEVRGIVRKVIVKARTTFKI